MNNMYGFTQLEAILYLILVFAPFLFIIVPTLICYKLTGKWWPKPKEEV